MVRKGQASPRRSDQVEGPVAVFVVVAGAGATFLPLSSSELSQVHAASAPADTRIGFYLVLSNWHTVSVRHTSIYGLINVQRDKKISAIQHRSTRRGRKFQLTTRSDFRTRTLSEGRSAYLDRIHRQPPPSSKASSLLKSSRQCLYPHSYRPPLAFWASSSPRTISALSSVPAWLLACRSPEVLLLNSFDTKA